MKARLRIFSLVMERIDGRDKKNIESNKKKVVVRRFYSRYSERGDIVGERNMRKI